MRPVVGSGAGVLWGEPWTLVAHPGAQVSSRPPTPSYHPIRKTSTLNVAAGWVLACTVTVAPGAAEIAPRYPSMDPAGAGDANARCQSHEPSRAFSIWIRLSAAPTGAARKPPAKANAHSAIKNARRLVYISPDLGRKLPRRTGELGSSRSRCQARPACAGPRGHGSGRPTRRRRAGPEHGFDVRRGGRSCGVLRALAHA